MSKKIKKCISGMLFILIILITNYSLAGHYASTFGTENNTAMTSKGGLSTITTKDIIDKAARCYEEMGYVLTYRLIDPSVEQIIRNLDARVLFFCTHGSIDSITFSNQVGISMNDTHTSSGGLWTYVGVQDTCKKAWTNNTDLVTYLACNTAGVDGKFSYDSLAFKTVDKGGSNLAIGFADEVPYNIAEKWSERFHSKLNQGRGVWDAMNYAISDPYFILWSAIDNRDIRECYLIYKRRLFNYNIVLSSYISDEVGGIEEDFGKLIECDDILDEEITIDDKDAENTVIEYLKKNDNEFNPENYTTKKSSCIAIDASTRQETEKVEYVCVGLKLGDFYTDSGYIAKIKSNKVIAIYDNNKIEHIAQKKALANKEKFYVKKDELNINKMKSKAVDESGLPNAYAEEDVKYYYDIENDKKYVIIPIRSELEDNNGEKDIFVDNILYEI